MYLEVGRLLRSRRIEVGLTLNEVVRKTGFKTQQHLSNIERGAASLPPRHVKAIASVLNISPFIITDTHIKAYAVGYLQRAGLIKKGQGNGKSRREKVPKHKGDRR